MPNDDDFNLEEAERERADSRLESDSVAEIAEFLDGSISPAYDLPTYCSERNLGKLFDVLLYIARVKSEDGADETVMVILNGLIRRYEKHGVTLDFVLSLIRAVKRLEFTTGGMESGPESTDKPLALSDANETNRRTVPYPKGVDLFSWRDAASGEWRFSLLLGTTYRPQTEMDIIDRERVLTSIDALKQQLAKLAVGERVFWSSSMWTSRYSQQIEPTFPPQDVIEDVARTAEELALDLNISR